MVTDQIRDADRSSLANEHRNCDDQRADDEMAKAAAALRQVEVEAAAEEVAAVRRTPK